MVKPLLEPYQVVVLGDREFCGVGLAQWLREQGWGYCLRLKKNTCIAQEQHLQEIAHQKKFSFIENKVKKVLGWAYY
ncbi:transposase [Anthocerotibacter panamensis]|uniref:transposase n=1 Tax=Anthocerotibacter panamensis TaxID=2857077 RepID=UPI001C4021C7|nr:transposase [Anthocerotibacter panamensis]